MQHPRRRAPRWAKGTTALHGMAHGAAQQSKAHRSRTATPRRQECRVRSVKTGGAQAAAWPTATHKENTAPCSQPLPAKRKCCRGSVGCEPLFCLPRPPLLVFTSHGLRVPFFDANPRNAGVLMLPLQRKPCERHTRSALAPTKSLPPRAGQWPQHLVAHMCAHCKCHGALPCPAHGRSRRRQRWLAELAAEQAALQPLAPLRAAHTTALTTKLPPTLHHCQAGKKQHTNLPHSFIIRSREEKEGWGAPRRWRKQGPCFTSGGRGPHNTRYKSDGP